MSFNGMLYLKLNQRYLPEGFFSETYPLSGTIYMDANMTTPFNGTAYPNIRVRIFHPLSWADLFNRTASWVSASSGTWQVFITKGQLPPADIYRIKVELTDANPPVNEELSTYPIEFPIVRMPSM